MDDIIGGFAAGAAAADTDESTKGGPVRAIRDRVDCFEKARLAGTVFADGADASGGMGGHTALRKDLGRGRQVELKIRS